MQEYNNTHAPYMSFYAGSFYQDVVRNWSGLCFFYLFLLVIATWLPDIYSIKQWVDNFAAEEAPLVVEQVPLIDGHNDLPYEVGTRFDGSFDSLDIAQPDFTLINLLELVDGSQIKDIWTHAGLDPDAAITVTPTGVDSANGRIDINITGDGNTSNTVTRQ